MERVVQPPGRAPRVIWNIAISGGSKFGTLILNLVLLRQYVAFFGGRDAAGLWLTLVAVLIAVVLFDFGIGNGLRNALAQRLAVGENRDALCAVSSAYALLIAIIVPIAAIASLVVMKADWMALLRVPPQLVGPAVLRECAIILIWGLAAYLVLGLVTAVMNAAQMTGLASLISLCTNGVLVIALMVLRPRETADALRLMAALQVVAMLLPQVIASLVIYSTRFRRLAPRPSAVRLAMVRELSGISVQFLFIQVSLIVLNGVNEPIIANLAGPGDVYSYQAYNRVFMLFSIAYSVTVSPVWARMAVDYGKGHIEALKQMYARMWKLAGAFIVLLAASNLAIPHFVQGWFGFPSRGTWPILLTMSLQAAFLIALYASTCLANACGRLRTQLVVLTLGAVAKIPVSAAVYAILPVWEVVIMVNAAVLLFASIAQTVRNAQFLTHLVGRPSTG